MKTKPLDFLLVMDDSPENRETMFRMMSDYDEPYKQYPALKRHGMSFFLGVTTKNHKLAFMTGNDAKESFHYLIAQWNHRNGLTRIDLPSAHIRWVSYL